MICEPAEWKRRVCMHGCQIHDDWGDCDPPLQAAHIIPQQSLKRRGLHSLLWDTRNGIGACYGAHRASDRSVVRSDGSSARFPRERIPLEAEAFAQEIGLDWMLDKLYGPRP